MKQSELVVPDGNVASRLAVQARTAADQIAIAAPTSRFQREKDRAYSTISFSELDDRVTRLAAGFQSIGVGPGKRIALLVPFGEDFITLVFSLLKTGATLVLVDPGMGRRNLLQCLEASNLDGFVGVPLVHAVRKFFSSRFPRAVKNVVVGRGSPFLAGVSLKQLEKESARSFRNPQTQWSSPAAIIFTTGSTGPPKGVLYTHSTFCNQIDQIVEHYGIQPGGRDLSGFPLFGLFNAVMGVTTVIPDMNPTRPADVDPLKYLHAIDQWSINQSFGSPALWTRIGTYCEKSKRKLPSLRRVLSAGAPVAPRVLQWMRDAIHPDGEMHTPYGATEALPVASIESREVLGETAERHRQGAGVCVGRRFSGIDWKVIRIDDGPLSERRDVREMPTGEIGELMVSGPVVSREYVTRTDQNAFHKVTDGDRIWHRMGDVGYLDHSDRFWYCGRKSHRVPTKNGNLFTEPCEAILNSHPQVYRSALVGVPSDSSPWREKISAEEASFPTPCMVIECWKDFVSNHENRSKLIEELRALAQSQSTTAEIEQFLIYSGRLPTDIRHNSKIFREQLVPWASRQLQQRAS